MAKQAVAAHAVDLEPIDRLEEKISRLVTMIGELRNTQARAQEENARLGQEVEALRARLADADTASAELLALRDERDVIRSRVSEMLQQLEAL
jgi:regulator of replication initiation timing